MLPNVITYSALISACEKGDWPKLAMEFFGTLTQQGVVPDVVAYSAVISACERANRP